MCYCRHPPEGLGFPLPLSLWVMEITTCKTEKNNKLTKNANILNVHTPGASESAHRILFRGHCQINKTQNIY